MKFETSCSAVIILLGSSCLAELAQTGQQQQAAQTDQQNVWISELKCSQNGGFTFLNVCVCPKYHSGEYCEDKTCMNGGTLETVTPKANAFSQAVQKICKCPNPEFITGEHCDTIRCANRGVLETFKKNSTWRCDCKGSRFYTGKFCEKFVVAPIWYQSAVCLFIFMALACAPLWFNRIRKITRNLEDPRPPPSDDQQQRQPSSTTGRSRSRGADALRRCEVPRNLPLPVLQSIRRSSSYDDLISDEEQPVVRPGTPDYENGFTQNVIRMPPNQAFNSHMIGAFEPMIPCAPPAGPPPSYNHAVSDSSAEPPSYEQAMKNNNS